jgi:hypothetical protein
MLRVVAAIFLSGALVLGSAASALADDSDKADEGLPNSKLPSANTANPDSDTSAKSGKRAARGAATGASKAGDSATKSAAPAKSSSKKSASGGLGARIGSTIIGGIGGIPVSMVRKSKQEIINATHDLVGESDNKWLWAAASPLCVPAGILSGVMQGFVYGPYNAWKYSDDEPFSPETFSLGDAK